MWALCPKKSSSATDHEAYFSFVVGFIYLEKEVNFYTNKNISEEMGLLVNDVLIQQLVDLLGRQKSEFLSDVRWSINSYISNKTPKNCLTVVERSANGTIYKEWKPDADIDYFNALYAFCRGQMFRGRIMDSVLTDPIVQLAGEKFQKLYNNNIEQISELLLVAILKNNIIVNSLVDTIVKSLHLDNVSGYAKNKFAAILIEQIQQIITSSSGHMIIDTAGSTIKAAISTPIIHSCATIIIKQLSLTLKYVIAKVLASAAFKTALVAIIKKFAATAIISVLVHIIGAKVIAVFGANIALIIIPLVIAYIYYKFQTLPETLGENVSQKVVENLDSNFTKINKNVAELLCNEVFGIAGSLIAKEVMKEKHIESVINEAAAVFA